VEGDIPAIGFISHVDTSPDFSGKNVNPQIVENYRGGDIALGIRDVGTLEAYWKANLDLASVTPELDMYDQNWPIRTHMESLPPA
ncbi:hypothetical protein MJL79_29085, partial [Salmonella enterica subsp. enterica serovar Montevideo]|nr:hypothetical protein [Salmonella enterica subsp. enterica serovar Montevideo]